MSDEPKLTVGYYVSGPSSGPQGANPFASAYRPGSSKSFGILNDAQIDSRCRRDALLTPYADHQVSEVGDKPVISYGLSSAGYDIRLGYHFKMANNLPGNALQVLDPKQRDQSSFVDFTSEQPLMIPPHGFILGESLEHFNMPRDLLGLAVNKSTYARCATVTLTTPAEPGWSGILTLEIANFTSLPIIVYPGEGITQIIFLQLLPCTVSYDDKHGKYQHQRGVQTAIV